MTELLLISALAIGGVIVMILFSLWLYRREQSAIDFIRGDNEADMKAERHDLTYSEKVRDYNGFMLEAITEADDRALEAISDAILQEDIMTIGAVVLSLAQDYLGHEKPRYAHLLRRIERNAEAENAALRKEVSDLRDDLSALRYLEDHIS